MSILDFLGAASGESARGGFFVAYMGELNRTIAFLIGSSVRSGLELRCDVEDAHCMAEVFRRLGYDVTEKCDCTVEDCTGILECFKKNIKYCDMSIFYYA